MGKFQKRGPRRGQQTGPLFLGLPVWSEEADEQEAVSSRESDHHGENESSGWAGGRRGEAPQAAWEPGRGQWAGA